MVFSYIKKKLWGADNHELQERLDTSVSKIQYDINVIKLWMTHLSKRSVDIDDKHNLHAQEITLTKKDIDDIKKWLTLLHNHTNELKQYANQTSEYLTKIDNQHKQVLARLDKMEQKLDKGHSGTPQGTFKGQVGDTKIEEKTHEILQKPTVIQRAKQIVGLDTNSLTGAETELANLMYHSDRPMSYEEIANRLGKKEKSIRNLIYELRRKGIDVSDKPIGIREKGFYLSSEAKLSISGR